MDQYVLCENHHTIQLYIYINDCALYNTKFNVSLNAHTFGTPVVAAGEGLS